MVKFVMLEESLAQGIEGEVISVYTVKSSACLLKSRGDVNFELSWMLEVVTPALVSTTSVYFDMSKMLES